MSSTAIVFDVNNRGGQACLLNILAAVGGVMQEGCSSNMVYFPALVDELPSEVFRHG